LTYDTHLTNGTSVVFLVLLVFSLFICMLVIWKQPQNTTITTFKVCLFDNGHNGKLNFF
jgi:hypothetical protein